jgi:hypothetical protein
LSFRGDRLPVSFLERNVFVASAPGKPVQAADTYSPICYAFKKGDTAAELAIYNPAVKNYGTLLTVRPVRPTDVPICA